MLVVCHRVRATAVRFPMARPYGGLFVLRVQARQPGLGRHQDDCCRQATYQKGNSVESHRSGIIDGRGSYATTDGNRPNGGTLAGAVAQPPSAGEPLRSPRIYPNKNDRPRGARFSDQCAHSAGQIDRERSVTYAIAIPPGTDSTNSSAGLPTWIMPNMSPDAMTALKDARFNPNQPSHRPPRADDSG